jgi:xylose dehydrogenase (NAD/NADP)
MSEGIRWGILSTAKITGAILGGAREAMGADVVAVASRDRERAEAFADANGIPEAYGSYEELLADDDVEAVYVPLPNSMHLPWSVRALEAGKHVLCEKPLSRRVADVEEAFDAASRAGRLLMEAFMWRYHPATETVVRLVEEGAIGRLRVVRAAFGFTLDPGAVNVRWAGELEGGALMDVGSYCISALRLLAGEPSSVSAERVDGGAGVDARMAGVLRFGGDVLGTFDCAFDVPYRAGIEVVGETGTIVSRDPWHGQSPGVQVLRPDTAPEDVPVEAANPYARELDDFAAAARGGRAPRLGRDDAVGQARVIEALYESAASGRAVAIA